jgi:hypothetical protein
LSGGKREGEVMSRKKARVKESRGNWGRQRGKGIKKE